MRNGWLYHSIAIGLAAFLLAFTILALASGISGAIPHDQPGMSNSLFFLTLITLLILEFACGMLSSLLARPAKGKAAPWPKSSLVAGFLPAVALCSFMVNKWKNSVPVYAPGTSTQISEPAPDFIMFAILVFLLAVCLLTSASGGCPARTALKPKANDRGS
jgi:peptidoglycan/LPS O-acetylase OafA/YrhL